MVTTTIRIGSEVHKRFKGRAVKRGMKVKAAAEAALEAWPGKERKGRDKP